MTYSLEQVIKLCHQRQHILFETYLKKIDCPAKDLQSAMYYALTNGGKRLRPTLVYVMGCIFETPLEWCDAPALSVELIHAFSLIHDDLPEMDNADLRRGKPTCHKVFGHAIAVLAGDALQTLAFEIIANDPSSLSANQRVQMIKTLAQSIGKDGMTAGQALDIKGTETLTELLHMYYLKTGALFSASLKLGMIASNVYDQKIEQALQTYCYALSLAFQIQDDLLDLQGNPEITGKTQGLDIQNKKPTFPILLSKIEAESKVTELFTQSLNAIKPLGDKFQLLIELAHSLMQRRK